MPSDVKRPLQLAARRAVAAQLAGGEQLTVSILSRS